MNESIKCGHKRVSIPSMEHYVVFWSVVDKCLDVKRILLYWSSKPGGVIPTGIVGLKGRSVPNGPTPPACVNFLKSSPNLYDYLAS